MHATYKFMFMVHFGMAPPPSILISSVLRFLLPTVIFKQSLDFSVDAIVTSSASMLQHVKGRPNIRISITRTTNEKDPTTVRTYEHRNKGRNNESEADLASLVVVFLILTAADMVV